MNRRQSQRGFSMIELLVVITILGLLASVVVLAVQDAYGKSRDSVRLTDLDTIAKSIVRYSLDNGNWMQGGSGCGADGDGNGWFSFSGSNYPTSMAQCLIDADILNEPLVDPSGASTVTEGQSGYMKYSCGSGPSTRVYIYAELESLPSGSTATDGTCCPDCDSNYDMNYFKEIQI